MIGFFIRFAASILALFVVAWLSNGAVRVDGVGSGILAALILGIGNAFIKPILYFIAQKVTCILSCITLGLWSLILSWGLSALIFFWSGQILAGFHVKTYTAALIGSLILAVVNTAANILTRKGEDSE